LATEARAVLDLAISEEEFMQQVLDCARLCGFLCYHTRDSRRSVPGFPDTVLVHPGRPGRPGTVLFVELKRQGGRLTVDQKQWRDVLLAAGARWFCWRPDQWDEIEVTLKGAA
jgi:hypothetical protein